MADITGRITETITFHFDDEEQQKRFHEILDNGSPPLAASVSSLREALAKLVTSAQLVLQNAEGCVVNYQIEDCENAIDAARAALNGVTQPATSTAANDVLAERERQKAVEGWTSEHDDTHENEDAKAVIDLMNAPQLTVSGLIAELEKIERDGGGDLPVFMHDDSEVREVCAYDADGNCRGQKVEVFIHGVR